MNIIYDIMSEYERMRENELDPKSSLYALRSYIETISDQDKDLLGQYIQQWETGELRIKKDSLLSINAETDRGSSLLMNTTSPSSLSAAPIKHLSQARPTGSLIGDLLRSKDTRRNETSLACSHCGAKNKPDEVICYSCGSLINSEATSNATRRFADTDPERVAPEFFGEDSLLILRLRDSQSYIRVRPQTYSNEMIIGRCSPNSAMMPDI